MPYIQTGQPQRRTDNPGVQDIYHSENVYINNVAAGVWQKPGASAAFAIDIAVAAVTAINDVAAQEAAGLTSRPMPAAAVSANAIEQDYQGTPAAEVTTSSAITSAVASDIVPWLAARLDESNRGMWTRQSPPQGKGAAVSPGNPNITGIWTAIGIPQYSNNDQTAWCMGFVNFGLKQCGYRWCPEASSQAITTNPGKWNATQVPLNQGQPGDICFWSYHHVNFIYTANNGVYTFVGGNQGGGGNNPSSSSVTNSWPNGTTDGKGTLVSIWRPSKS